MLFILRHRDIGNKMINTIKEDELGMIIPCFSCLHSQNIQLQNIQFSFICLKFFDSCLQRLCVLWYHAHVTFMRQSWIHFNLVSVSDAAFNLRFLRWWKCISFKWLIEIKKKKKNELGVLTNIQISQPHPIQYKAWQVAIQKSSLLEAKLLASTRVNSGRGQHTSCLTTQAASPRAKRTLQFQRSELSPS